MATKIRRSLFVGLGGTGMRTLLSLKKLFVDTYGEIPPMIAFLGVDTDRGEFTKELQTKASGNVGVMSDGTVETTLFVRGQHVPKQTVRLEPFEQIQITIEHPRDVYNVRKQTFTWIPQENIYSLQSLTRGAGQVRTNGRFAIIANSQDVENKVRDALTRVANVRNIDNPNYELIDQVTDIYMIFSLGGGTGCGTFIDMAYIIRRCDRDCKLAGYVLLPTVFKTRFQNGVDRVMPNGYGAMLDLDWFMCQDWANNNITLPIQNGRTTDTKGVPPFDACIFIDNENRTQDKYTDNTQLEEMIAHSLVTAVGELAVQNTSVLDNLSVNAREGAFDVENKRAWVSGMGVCELLVQSNEIRKIFSHNAAKYLINNLLSKVDMSDEVLNWINSPDISICEHEADQVIDFLLKRDPIPMPTLDKGDYKDSMGVCNVYIESQTTCPDVEGRLVGLKDRVSGKLRSFLIETLNRRSGSGVGAALDMLQSLNGYVRQYLKEMEDECADFVSKENSYVNALKSRVTELANARFYQNRSEMASEVEDAATALATLRREILRRKYAIQFFNELIINVRNYYDDVKVLADRLERSLESSNNEIARIRTSLSQNTETFQYDISQNVMELANVEDNHIQIADYIDSLEGNKIYDLLEMESVNIWKSLLNYTYFSSHAKGIGKLSINEVLDQLSEKEFDDLVKKVVVKASPLLPHDYHGYTNTRPLVNYYIGVDGFDTNRMYKDNYFKNNIREANDVNFSNIGMSDRIIVFSQMNPIPPFAIASMTQCKREYEEHRHSINFHIDDHIYQQMKNRGYDLFPSVANDDVMDVWLKGFLFGKIKNENGKYQVQSKNEGSSLRHYWVVLGESRGEAYKTFEQKSSVYCPEIENYIAELREKNGEDKYRAIIDDAKMGDNYLNMVSQVNMSLDELEQRQNREILDLLETEKKILDEM